jgi:ribosomal protein S18 acetylase RimI-like enzyme
MEGGAQAAFGSVTKKETAMTYELVPASIDDKEWLERLRRDVYQDLFQATFGGWDEVRHTRHFTECWERGSVFIIKVEGTSVGMIQLFDDADKVEVGEIQIDTPHQNKGIGSRVLVDTVARAHADNKTVTLSVGLKNGRALRLYERIGFKKVARSDTHDHMACNPQH